MDIKHVLRRSFIPQRLVTDASSSNGPVDVLFIFAGLNKERKSEAPAAREYLRLKSIIHLAVQSGVSSKRTCQQKGHLVILKGIGVQLVVRRERWSAEEG